MVDKQGITTESAEQSPPTDEQPAPLSPANANQTVIQEGRNNAVIGERADVQMGDRYYNMIDAEGLRALLQAFGSHLPPAALAEAPIAPDDNGGLPILSFEAALAKRINARLTTLEELDKAGQLVPRGGNAHILKESVLED